MGTTIVCGDRFSNVPEKWSSHLFIKSLPTMFQILLLLLTSGLWVKSIGAAPFVTITDHYAHLANSVTRPVLVRLTRPSKSVSLFFTSFNPYEKIVSYYPTKWVLCALCEWCRLCILVGVSCVLPIRCCDSEIRRIRCASHLHPHCSDGLQFTNNRERRIAHQRGVILGLRHSQAFR